MQANRLGAVLKAREEAQAAAAAASKQQTTSKQQQTDGKQQQGDSQRKQTWEQALAHINQLAKGAGKEKKKQKEPQAKVEQKVAKKEPQRSNSLPETQSLSKKQRKLLAKQQAEEEEKKIQQEKEAKNKRNEAKKAEAEKSEAKSDAPKKTEKKAEPKNQEPAKSKKEEKKEKKLEKAKESKQEKNAPAAKVKPVQQTQQNQPPKKEKKQTAKQVVNITPDTTIEVVGKQTPSNEEQERASSCSIMQQLSSGVQVADLRLPPGITLTRVQPNEKKEPPVIKSVPAWKSSQLAAAPTPVARPPPVINAEPSAMVFTTAHPEPPKPIIVAEPPPPAPGKSKKAKKKAKKAAAAADENKQEGAKMVTLRNPMFHPNLPPVQVTNQPAQKKSEQIRIPDPIPMPPNACQATITPTSNGMYTIRNPLMSIMHQQSLMGIRNPSPQMNPVYGQPFNYVNPNVYNPVPTAPNQYIEQRTSPKPDEFQTRIMNLASFTQKNEEGYSLFQTSDDNQQRNFLTPEYYVEDQSPKTMVSPNPIGTRPAENRCFESESLFANPIQRPEPIGTLKKEDHEYTGLYTPFGQEDRNVFRNALFSDKSDMNLGMGKTEELDHHVTNGDPLPYFQRLRVGSKLNNEVTIHHVTESKFYKGQEPGQPLVESPMDDSLFSKAPHGWPDHMYGPPNKPAGGCGAACFGPVGTRPAPPDKEPSVFLPDASITNLSTLETAEREIESFKRFDFYFSPPQQKPRVQLDLQNIAANLRHNHQ